MGVLEDILEENTNMDNLEVSPILSFLCRQGILRAVSALVSKTKWQKGQRRLASMFIRLCLTMVSKFIVIPSFVPTLCQVLYRIFHIGSKIPPFYNVKSIKEEITEADKKKFLDLSVSESEPFARSNRGDKNVSLYLYIHINYFCHHLKGLSSFNKVLVNEETTIHRLAMILKILNLLKPHLPNQFWKAYIQEIMEPLREMIMKCVTKNGGSWKREDRSHFDDIKFMYLPSLLPLVSMPEEKVHEYIIDMIIQISSETSKMDNLESRLQSLKDIKRVLEMIRKKGKFLGKIFSGDSDEFEFKVDEKYVYQKLLENNFLEYYMSIISSHVEIFRQGLFLFTLFAKENSLKENHLDTIWNMSLNLHEHDKGVIYTSLSTLSEFFTPQLLEYLMKKIESIEITDLQTLDLVNDMLHVSAKTESSKKWTGLDILWKVFQGNEATRAKFERISMLSAKAFDHLLAILVSEVGSSQVKRFVSLSCDNLKAHRDPLYALVLIQKTLSVNKKKKKYVNDLESNYKLLSLFLEDFQKFKSTVKKQLKAAKSNGINEDVDSKIFVDRGAPYIEEVSHRFDFISYLLSNSSLILSLDFLDKFWDITITKAITPKEKEISFKWWSLASQKSARQESFTLSESSISHIFVNKMLKEDVVDITIDGYKLFEDFFLSVNEKNGNISRKGDKSSDLVGLISLESTGLSNLWDISLNSPNEEISKMAINLLTNLYSNLELFNSKSNSTKFRDGFFSKLMGELTLATEVMNREDESHPVDGQKKVKRCLSILRRCILKMKVVVLDLKDVDKENVASQKSSEALKLNAKCSGKPSRRLVVSSSTTVGTLKSKILEIFELDFPLEQASLYVEDDKTKELVCNDRTVVSYKIAPESTVVVKRVNEVRIENNGENSVYGWILSLLKLGYSGSGLVPANYSDLVYDKITAKSSWSLFSKNKESPKDVKTEKKTDSPIRFLSSENNFKQLYRLLKYPDVNIAEQIWELLRMVPINSELLKTIGNISSLEELENFLDLKDKYLFLYHLEVFNEIVSLMPQYKNDKQRNRKPYSAWFEKEISGSILKHLFYVLSIIDIPKFDDDKSSDVTSSNDKANLESIASMFKILTSVLLDKENQNLLVISDLEFQDTFGDTNEFIRKLLDIIAWSCECSDFELCHTLVERAAVLLTSLLLLSKEVCLQFISTNDMQLWLKKTLLSYNELSRKRIAHCFINIIDFLHEEQDLYKLYNDLSATFQESNLMLNACDEFYFLLMHLIESISLDAFKLPQVTLKPKKLLKSITDSFIKHPLIEESSSDPEDKILIGYMKLLNVIVRKDRKLKNKTQDLTNYLFSECLFAIPDQDTNNETNEPPKCKTSISRDAGFSLLKELVRGCPKNYNVVVRLLTDLVSKLRSPTKVGNFRSGKKNNIMGYLGLINQGATCYMNSSLQQLYMVPELRQKILQANASINEELLKENTDAEELYSENMLFQLQRLFAFLQESNLRAFDTKDFCSSYRGFGNEPLNVGQQMDAVEFVNGLFDGLETHLKTTDQENFLKNLFGGYLSNQIIPTECDHKKETLEDFYTISLEIKNKNNLIDSLKLFIEGEILSGDNKYNCETCGKRVEILKRYCIDTLPPYLILHLKRFEFDYSTMRQEKINTFCSFPFELDLAPYMRETLARNEAKEGANMDDIPNRPQSYYEYELSGVIVHVGSCNSGHYYSFIKEKVPLQGDKQRWFEFNDSTVSPFDLDRLEQECFGGDYIANVYDKDKDQYVKTTKTRSNNAYILVYERKKKGAKEDLNGKSEVTDTLSHCTPKVKMPQVLSELVKSENKTNHLKGYVFNEEFNELLWSLIGYHSPNPLKYLNSPWNISAFKQRILDVEKKKLERKKKKSPEASTQHKGASKKSKENKQNEGKPVEVVVSKYQSVDPFETLPSKMSKMDKIIDRWAVLAKENKAFNSPSQNIRTIELLMDYLTRIYIHSIDPRVFTMWINTIQNIIAEDQEVARWVLNYFISIPQKLLYLLTSIASQRVRTSFGNIITAALLSLAPHERDLYSTSQSIILPKQTSLTQIPPSYCIWFLEYLLAIWKKVNKGYCDAYCVIFEMFRALSKHERKYLEKRGIITFLKVMGTD